MFRKLILIIIGLSCCITFAFGQSSATAKQKRLHDIQGTYLIDKSASMGDADMVHQYGRYIIYDDTFTEYSWDEVRKTWVVEFSLPYKLIYKSNADYMTGWNIVVKYPSGYEMQMCTGDVNGDGIMDLWSSDSIFYTKQKE